jgi:hypothetical protein
MSVSWQRKASRRLRRPSLLSICIDRVALTISDCAGSPRQEKGAQPAHLISRVHEL